MSGWLPVAVKRSWLSPVPTSPTLTERVVESDHPPQDTRLISHRLRIYAPHHGVISKYWNAHKLGILFLWQIGDRLSDLTPLYVEVCRMRVYIVLVSGWPGYFTFLAINLGKLTRAHPTHPPVELLCPGFPFYRTAWRNQSLFKTVPDELVSKTWKSRMNQKSCRRRWR